MCHNISPKHYLMRKLDSVQCDALSCSNMSELESCITEKQAAAFFVLFHVGVVYLRTECFKEMPHQLLNWTVSPDV